MGIDAASEVEGEGEDSLRVDVTNSGFVVSMKFPGASKKVDSSFPGLVRETTRKARSKNARKPPPAKGSLESAS